MNKGITEDKKRNCTSSFCDSPLIKISDLLKNIANAIIIVKLAMLEPKTFPTDRPPSFDADDSIDTESSGNEVVTDNSTNPAAISERPKTFDKTREYLIILSLTMPIRNNAITRMRILNTIIFYLSKINLQAFLIL